MVRFTAGFVDGELNLILTLQQDSLVSQMPSPAAVQARGVPCGTNLETNPLHLREWLSAFGYWNSWSLITSWQKTKYDLLFKRWNISVLF